MRFAVANWRRKFNGRNMYVELKMPHNKAVYFIAQDCMQWLESSRV